MMRFPQNTLRTGVNTWTPTCTVEHLCPPVLWRSDYPALIANTNISPQSNFPLKVINTLHKRFYWRREVVGAVHMGGARVRTCTLTNFNTWLPNERGSVQELWDSLRYEESAQQQCASEAYSTSLLPPQESRNFPPVCLCSRVGAPHQIKHDLWPTNADVHCLLQSPPSSVGTLSSTCIKGTVHSRMTKIWHLFNPHGTILPWQPPAFVG